MADLVVHPQERPLRGGVPLPSDKSIGHRAVLLGAVASGDSEIRGLSYAEDNVSTLRAMAAMGVTVQDDGRGTVRLRGVGLEGLREPAGPIDCGNSGTTMRLLAGLLAAQPFGAVLVGDASLSRRPMSRVADPLRRRGARVEGTPHPTRAGEITAPLAVGPIDPGARLGGIDHESRVPSAQVKSALVLSGLRASGPTRVREPTVSRDHTERMLRALGAPLRAVGPLVELDPAGWDGRLPGLSVEVPGDLSAAAFLLAAALVVPGSVVRVRRAGTNPTRAGFLDAARAMGAAVEAETHGDELGEPLGDVAAAHGPLRATTIAGETVARAVDEVPVLCALAARARGTTEIADAAELRVKESDRIAQMAAVLRAFGAGVEERPDGLLVEGRPEGPLAAADVDSAGDHRIAMTAAVLALCADGPSRVRRADCIATSFPRFVGTMRALGARIEVL